MSMPSNDKTLRYLSLAAKAGKLTTGAERCEEAVKKGQGKLLVLASDAANNASRMAKRVSSERNLPLIRSNYTKSELAAAVGGKGAVAVALIRDGNLAEAYAAAAANGMEQEESK